MPRQELVAALLRKECQIQVLNLSCNNFGAAGAVLAIPLRYSDGDVTICIVNTTSFKFTEACCRYLIPFIHESNFLINCHKKSALGMLEGH